MSAELIAIVAAAVSLGGLFTIQVGGLRSSLGARLEAIDARLRTVATELAYLRGLLQGAGFTPQPRGASDRTDGAA